VEFFSDRVTITSTGGLVEGLSREDFFNGHAMPRNRELMRVFKDVELVEELGSGMRRILEAYDRSVFEITPSFIVATFPYASDFDRNEDDDLHGNLHGDLHSTDQDSDQDSDQDDHVEKLLEFCGAPRSLSEIQQLFGRTHKSYFRAKIMRPLLESGKLKMTIPDKPNSRNQKYIRT
jgi:predicted HTH transcriptional regulator